MSYIHFRGYCNVLVGSSMDTQFSDSGRFCNWFGLDPLIAPCCVGHCEMFKNLWSFGRIGKFSPVPWIFLEPLENMDNLISIQFFFPNWRLKQSHRCQLWVVKGFLWCGHPALLFITKECVYLILQLQLWHTYAWSTSVLAMGMPHNQICRRLLNV